MKYSRLTKEQFEALGEEFALFLSSNSIDIKQWDKIKTNSAESVEHILDMFSDLVWDDILDKVKFIHKDHLLAVLDIDYSPTGREFVSASFDKTIRLSN